MARTKQYSQSVKKFTGGLISDVSPLEFPMNASVSEENFDINRDGTRGRRLGIDYESGAIFRTIDSVTKAIRNFKWENVAQDGLLEFMVVQHGNELHFYEPIDGNVSGNSVNSGVAVEIPGDQEKPVSVASVFGYLVVVHGTQYVYILEYDKTTDTITKTEKKISARDHWGVSYPPKYDRRVLSADGIHPSATYNLRNQGWPNRFHCISNIADTTVTLNDPIQYMAGSTHSSIPIDDRERYPAQNDMFVLGVTDYATNANSVGSFCPVNLLKSDTGTLTPSKGSMVIDLFDIGESRLEQVALDKKRGTVEDWSTVNTDNFDYAEWTEEVIDGGIETVTAFAGRVFFSFSVNNHTGLHDRSFALSGFVFFSKVVESIEDIVTCHSNNDPTSMDYFEPLATDGGFISVPEAGIIKGCSTIGRSVIILGTNGAWEIYGEDGVFSATNQSKSKVTELGCNNEKSIVTTESEIFYWSQHDIVAISVDPSSYRAIGQSISEGAINTLFNEIPSSLRRGAVGEYDSLGKRLMWLYRESDDTPTQFKDSCLVLDLNWRSFIKYTFPRDGVNCPYVVGLIPLTEGIEVFEEVAVTLDDDEIVYIDAGETDIVTVDSDTALSALPTSVKYITVVLDSGVWKYTASELNQTKFYDWDSHAAETYDAKGFMVTGYATLDATHLKKQASYLTTHMLRTERGFDDTSTEDNMIVLGESGCLCQTQWEWTNHADAGKWGTQFQIYRLPRLYIPSGVGDDFSTYGYELVTVKNRLRGRGRALSLKFETEEGKDCQILGWDLSIAANDKE